ncbi:hypothetical protein [Streptomyces sp. WAC00263]|uniref:hypothetical protein n=1 Tax=Streptomyces sp. WAC00263 TaxID=1917422 RepID=UPI001F51453B|nr:hypothetical protein [Streptomyces sp. WAC00263]
MSTLQPPHLDSVLAYEPFDAFAVDDHTARAKLGGDPLGPVRLSGLRVDLAYPPGECSVRGLFRGAGRGGLQPPLEPGPRQIQHDAQPLHAEGATVVGNELEAAQEP